MADKMLIDATHPEETRVVVVRGNRVEEFDFESANRKQLRGNIYLAKVTRVEPSLQAAFVDYGGNRHGFLAFSEIHPDYYQIPVADRQALLAQEEEDHRSAEQEHENRSQRRGRRHRNRGSERHRDRNRDTVRSEAIAGEDGTAPDAAAETTDINAAESGLDAAAQADLNETASTLSEPTPAFETPSHAPETAEPVASEAAPAEPAPVEAPAPETAIVEPPLFEVTTAPVAPEAEPQPALTPEHNEEHAETGDHLDEPVEAAAEANGDEAAPAEARERAPAEGDEDEHGDDEHEHEEEVVESVGGADALEEVQERVPRFRKQYKIQEVIKRRQVMLVQVVKEERGSKGAALTTYLSLAGRYSVLMPNTARGGGISRKITSAEDRNRLKEIAQELEVPEGMGVILRTAGAARTKSEVKRDFEYLLRLWETVRDLTLKSTAPMLVYEEGSLVKRSIRDLYSKDIDEIIVSGEEGFNEARDFMRMLMPSHVRNVKFYKDNQPLFTRYGIESQLDAMFSPIVQLRSGGYIVINQTEALVAIDVNSGRATREHHIEDTALKTNVEAAEEVARQLRLRDLAGLIVIDFIDMDENRNNRTVERKLKDALKHDRARIQVGRISHFGLMEMSRQRIRTSVLESSTEKCPVCGGSGHVRSVSSVALQCLRAVEEMLNKGATHNLIVRTRSEVALYMLNHKRAHLRALEERFRITITVSADAGVNAQQSYIVDRGEQVHTAEAARALAAQAQPELIVPEEEEPEAYAGEEEEFAETEGEEEAGETAEAAEGESEATREGGDQRRRRRRRGRGRGRGRGEEAPREAQPFTQETAAEHAVAHEDHDGGSPEEEGLDAEAPQEAREEGAAGENGDRRRRRRGRRGGRRNRHRGDGLPGTEPREGEQAASYEEGVHETADGVSHPVLSDEDASVIAPPFAQPTPVHGEAEAAAPAPEPVAESAPAPEAAPRRRSTVREPAPIVTSEEVMLPPPAPAPVEIQAPTPVVSSTGEEPAAPKRGWWGRRLLGDKG
ncbi:ribonuclease E/G [Pseudolabrys taiwanensis]|uniref:Ribonuclease E n=1 Tax=Pseudolabrys taiwanensis TaxID=331696 RepID=A0A345ZU27_9HYPH|nr:ribonuclease E/G [Pseudolabrys taiwanensis]AXK80424.1 ribonuclease E/G [Pseudolabrys taiwanensis]